ncbi:MAG: hypothetical protein H0X39_19840 [Actinobacteria bacterium]|nr:hypothetical protein [Actinomycetota bacterium]
MTETEAKWTERVREWRASAQKAEQFAQGRGFEASTLRYWASRLRTKTATTAVTSMAEETSAKPRRDTLRMVRVRRRRLAATSATAGLETMASAAPMLIAVGGSRIEVRPGFDRGLLREVVEALGGSQ